MSQIVALSGESHRILKPGCLLMRRVNSSAANEIAKDKTTLPEENYYPIGPRCIRLLCREPFDHFFGAFQMLSPEDIHTLRFKNPWDRCSGLPEACG